MAGKTRFNVKVIRPRRAKFDNTAFLIGATAIMRATVADGKRFIAKYPPQVLTLTGYVRTGTLKRSWSSRTKISGSRIAGVVGSNGNIAPYNEIVQGHDDERDAQFTMAGWRGVDELEFMLQTTIERDVDALVVSLTR